MNIPLPMPDGYAPDSCPADVTAPRRAQDASEGHGWIERGTCAGPLTEESGPLTAADERLRRKMRQAVRDVAKELEGGAPE